MEVTTPRAPPPLPLSRPPRGLPSRTSRHACVRVAALHKQWAATARGADAAARAARAPLAEPDEATHEMLTLLRDPRNVEVLLPFLPAPPRRPAQPVAVAGVLVTEGGPLAGCAAFMDAAARRALPGHLLRRSRILSSLRVGGGECLQRVAVTACSGEELVLNWRLRHAAPADSSGGCSSIDGRGCGGAPGEGERPAEGLPTPGGASSSSSEPSNHGSAEATSTSTSSSDGAGGTAAVETAWQLVSIARDASSDGDSCAARPHPRLPPEGVVLSQLAALRRGALHEAARFMVWGRHAASAGWDAPMQEFRSLLRRDPLHAALTHDSVELGAGALPVGQRSFLQEVRLVRRGRGGGDRVRLLYWLNQHADGCWLIREFEAR